MNKFYKNLIPALISSLLCSCFVLVDGIFIGQKIGDIGLSAINIAWPITAFIQAVGSSIGLAFGIHISTLLGENKVNDANKLKGTSIVILFILSIILAITAALGSVLSTQESNAAVKSIPNSKVKFFIAKREPDTISVRFADETSELKSSLRFNISAR